jgi:hypothetical protein
MIRSTLLVIALFGCVAVAPAAPPRQDEHTKKIDAAVQKGLKYLAGAQNGDGSWGTYRNGGRHPAISGLAVMAFLAAGHVPGEGPYGQVVEKGVRAVLRMQHPNGLIAAEAGHEMYHHGICTLMLAEVVGMTQGPLVADVKKALEKAVAIILTAQRKQQTNYKGGWRYRVAGYDSDMSVTGWQLMALRAAKNVGCDVPPESIDLALDYIKRSRNPDSGGYCYTPGGGVTIPCTGTAILCLAVCGKRVKEMPEAQKAANFILRNLPDNARTRSTFARGGHFFYSIYYCTQAMFQMGDNFWEGFRPAMQKTLLDMQNANTGSWTGDSYGPNYASAMAILALAVEYRFLPIYQRGEEPSDKK